MSDGHGQSSQTSPQLLRQLRQLFSVDSRRGKARHFWILLEACRLEASALCAAPPRNSACFFLYRFLLFFLLLFPSFLSFCLSLFSSFSCSFLAFCLPFCLSPRNQPVKTHRIMENNAKIRNKKYTTPHYSAEATKSCERKTVVDLSRL